MNLAADSRSRRRDFARWYCNPDTLMPSALQYAARDNPLPLKRSICETSNLLFVMHHDRQRRHTTEPAVALGVTKHAQHTKAFIF
jgi:hypothetical protein